MTQSKNKASNSVLLSIYIIAILTGTIWLLHNIVREGAAGIEADIQNLTLQETINSLGSDVAENIRIDAAIVKDLAVSKTTFPLHPYSVCRSSSALSIYNAAYLYGNIEKAMGCLIETNKPLAKTNIVDLSPADGTDVTDTSRSIKIIREQLSGRELWIVSPEFSSDAASEPTQWLLNDSYTGRLASLSRLGQSQEYKALWRYALSLTSSSNSISQTTLLLFTDTNSLQAGPTNDALTLIPLAGSRFRLFVQTNNISSVPENGPIEGSLSSADASDYSFANRYGLTPSDQIGIIQYRSISQLVQRRNQERNQAILWSTSLIVISVLGLVRARERKAEQIRLYTTHTDSDLSEDDDSEQHEQLTMSSDDIPSERQTDLLARSSTLKDWIMATDDDRKQFVRTCVVKWTGKSDQDHIEGLQSFLTMCVATVIDKYPDGAESPPEDKETRSDILIMLANEAAGRTTSDEEIHQDEILAAGRFRLKKSPALAALTATRALRWFAKVGAEALSFPKKPA